MLAALKKLFGDSNERELKKLFPLVDEINEIAEGLESLSDDELKAKTAGFKAQIAEAGAPIEAEQAEVRARLLAAGEDDDAVGGDGQAVPTGLSVRERQDLYARLDDLEGEWLDAVEDVLDDILAEAFAVIKETCRRFVGKTWEAGGAEVEWQMVPFDVQLLGGAVLHQGSVAEMKTGEGKTLTSVAPLYLNALVGRGVHVVTVNPYLAQRDAEWMGPVFAFHGLTVDCIDKHPSHSPGRRAAYRADITYGTNNEFGFDYLRDNSFVVDANQLVQRGHHYAIVDEVDSVLIDEARTPLIISGPVPQSDVDEYKEFQPPVERLIRAQQKLVAGYVSDAERKLKAADEAEAAGNKKEAAALRDDAGLDLLRAQRGYPRNPKLIKLKGEPGVEMMIRSVESVYLADSGKRMPEVDEPLYFSLVESQHQIEMTDRGRETVGQAAGTDADFFVIPDVGEEIAQIERTYDDKKADLVESLREDDSLDEEKRQNKLDNDLRELRNEAEESKRKVYTEYAEKSERIHAVNQLLRGYTLYERDKEYIVQDDKVMIVDEHTGRVLPGRRYSDGLHQAIEAKERVKVQAATQTYATITIQNYFRLYSKLAGMTGTAETEAEEFGKIYSLPVVVVPTNRPIARADDDDLIYKSKRAKYKALLDRIEEIHATGQPILVGTASVEASEQVARLLQRAGIKHNVLNAKASRAQAESQIVAEAGQKGAVTIATNMAGRGTDIKLGEGVKELGGLAILGTERHDSRRIDLQLRGRAGRQGDPGFSQFYVSLEDDLMRLFGHDRTAKIMDRLGMEEDEVLTHKWLTKGVARSQAKVEQNHFASRKRQLEYDDVLNAQREVIYDRRMNALEGDRLRGDILEMLRGLVEKIVGEHFGNGDLEEIREGLLRHLAFDFEIDPMTASTLGADGLVERILDEATSHYRRKRAALARPFFQSAQQMMDAAEEDKRPSKLYVDFTDGRKVLRATVTPDAVIESEGQEINDALERAAVLSVIDEKWTEHLRDLDEVKEGVGLRAYGQKDPLIEYKMEAYRLFKELVQTVDEEVVGLVFKAGPLVQGDSQRQAARRVTQVAKPRLDARRATAQQEAAPPLAATAGGDGASSAERDPTAKAAPVVAEKTVGRNEPCYCGSGKKYKHCHGRG
ncbi:preprotein translocase subunit SecA [Rubrivirga litoralis]|uniref:Protein translocase subunit SecA n=1 Tax=Rubrivirga litoralis TaxID=3075598 RepID=A0ABU3BM75_9BACT|nr:preprotein translocase subunit SecA [Rubrivirga sp. F394]MDT0630376.1 preprotein translocase subunit SecA [Rubrivirga sp. F394]